MPPLSYAFLAVAKILIFTLIHEEGYRLKFQRIFFNWGEEWDALTSTPFSGEERSLKLMQMHPKDEQNKEHRDHSLKKNLFFPFLSILLVGNPVL